MFKIWYLSCIWFVSIVLSYTLGGKHSQLPEPLALRKETERSSRRIPTPKGECHWDWVVNVEILKCGEVGRDLVVNFVNSNYPNDDTDAGDCKFRMVVTSQHTCQIRVDFVDTELMHPVRGECLSQFFIVQGAIWPTGLPPLCGINTDQHFYLHLEPWYGNATIVDFNLITVIRGRPYRFGVWLTQIDCSSFNVLKAPEGCTQYFLAENGTIKSFNYEGFRYLNAQSYQICIRPVKGVCGVQYAADAGEFAMKKSITGNLDVMQRSGIGPAICGTDYVLIPEGKNAVTNVRIQRLLFNRRRPPAPSPAPPPPRKRSVVTPTSDRFCGATLSPVAGENTNRAIFARVRSNLMYLRVKTTPLQEERGAVEALNLTSGFRIAYSQLKECGDNEAELVLPQSVNAILDSIQWNSDGELSLRDTTLSSSSELPSSENINSSLAANDSSELVPEDELWEYLETHTDDNNDDEEKDLYDF